MILKDNEQYDEVFMEVPDTNKRYWASTKGYIWDMKLGKKVPTRKTKRGWYDCKIWFNGIRKTINIHRVILLTYYGPSKLTGNHIDGNKANNDLDNLEYMSLKEQNWHRSRELNRGNQNPIYCVETGDIYPNAKVAAEVLKIGDYSYISAVVNNKYGFKSVKGYHFIKV